MKTNNRSMLSIFKVFALIQILSIAVLIGADTLKRDDFPSDFVFGASTSAYQVEGATHEDGRKPSIWDTFAQNGNANMFEGDGGIGCGQYHKYKEDVQLMANMGLDAYRFSISWSRLIPDGRGQVNPKGVEYYNNLINELISHGIQPHVTLYHFDLPQTLEDEYEGWINRRIVRDFAAYADVCFREFGDRVKYWITVNEANVFSIGAYDSGNVPPQRCSSFRANCTRGNSSTEPYLAAHHIMLSHASAARLYRTKYQGKQHGFIGINLLNRGFVPLTNTTEDISATERAWEFYMGWFLKPFFYGDYPEIMREVVGSRLPYFTEKESNLIKGSMDFLGINYYYTSYAKNKPRRKKLKNVDFYTDMSVKQIKSTKLNGTARAEITTCGLAGAIDSLKNIYGNFPIYVHENGLKLPRNSSLDDWQRVKYLSGCVEATVNALRNGTNVRGYFVWSLFDVFEMRSGYESTLGLYYIDMADPNLRRQPKTSALWYSNFLNKTTEPKVTLEIEKDEPVLSHTPSLNNAAQK